jgi:p-hydroxybenzoate 3-monooxygenase
MSHAEMTQVVIIGAGPAGLLLGALLNKAGIENVILESRDRPYVEARIRAGVLEQGTVSLLEKVGVSARLKSEGSPHDGTIFALHGKQHHINFKELTGKNVTVYGQTEVVKDLIKDRLAKTLPLHFEAKVLKLDHLHDRPHVTYEQNGAIKTITCDYIAGCDGFHGVSRAHVPATKVWEKVYPFAWLGILANVEPAADELIYARSCKGFGLYSMRSAKVSRNYIQCKPDENLDHWSDNKVWDRLCEIVDKDIKRGEVTEKMVLPMRSFIHEPMRHGNLFLCGDAAHIVPPTGAKGLNLAASDVYYLYKGLKTHYKDKSVEGLNAYSDKALARIWKASRFSWRMTTMFHTNNDAFEDRLNEAELEYMLTSKPAQTSMAENYVGLPF